MPQDVSYPGHPDSHEATAGVRRFFIFLSSSARNPNVSLEKCVSGSNVSEIISPDKIRHKKFHSELSARKALSSPRDWPASSAFWQACCNPSCSLSSKRPGRIGQRRCHIVSVFLVLRTGFLLCLKVITSRLCVHANRFTAHLPPYLFYGRRQVVSTLS